MNGYLKFIFVVLLPLSIIFIVVFSYNSDFDRDYFPTSKIEVKKTVTPVDHSKFEVLQQDFEKPQDVTEACLSCHNGRGEEFMKTEHWNWHKKDTVANRGIRDLGKKNVLNNFCVGINSNEKLCSLCHAGYGYGDKNFDFTNQSNIDCLICHDETGKYKKSKPGTGPNTGSGMPNPKVNLAEVAQNVGAPQRENCGSCHYKGGGGNNVKHGDLEKALNHCTAEVDVHMATDKQNMACTDCHETHNHNITGKLYTMSTSPDKEVSCEKCHTGSPHRSKLLNDHYQQVACQTCHIPTYAKVNPTLVYWDWSTAGKLKDGEEFHEVSKDKMHKYGSKHGDQTFGKNLKPEYVWFNGHAEPTTIDTKISEDERPLVLNKLSGSYADNVSPEDSTSRSKIWPVKVMRGKQLYDPVNRTLIQPKTVGPKGSGAYWKDFDWGASAKAGMDYLNRPYSGKYDFIETQAYWPLNHMVSTADEALKCTDCHSKNGVLTKPNDFYLPGRNHSSVIDKGGWIFLLLVFLGVIIHGTIRIVSKKKSNF
jgi:octaheme c-type cytochrome (tetrathionate reductase family)